MKLVIRFSISVFMLLTLGLLIMLHEPKVSAQACYNTSSYGSITQNFSNVKSDKSIIWIRMKSPEGGGKVFAEVNNTKCLEISGEYSEEWQWRTSEVNGQSQKINLKNNSLNTVKLIGVDSGVKVDRILVTDESCVPIDYGTNCQSSIEASQDSSEKATPIKSLAAGVVSGDVLISETPEINREKMTELIYSSGGKILQRSNEPRYFNTMLLQNGKQTVYITTTLGDGTKIREYAEIDIKNQETPFTPVYRWFLLNRSSLFVAVSVVAGLAIFLFTTRLVVRLIIKKRWRNS